MIVAMSDSRSVSIPVPPLPPMLQLAVQKCGTNFHLPVDIAIMADCGFSAALSFTAQQSQTPSRLSRTTLWSRPLQHVLLSELATCSCSPLHQMSFQCLAPSGSTAEGLDDGRHAKSPSSDQDIMHQLGPVSWAEACKSSERVEGDGCLDVPAAEADGTGGNVAKLGDVDNLQHGHTAIEKPKLKLVPTENPGFVRLFQQRLSTCKHEQDLEFSAETIREFTNEFCRLEVMSNRELSANGPATSFSESSETGRAVDIDVVPCLHLPEWLSDEFFVRSRRRDWPTARVREDMRKFGMHLVPVGAVGSRTQRNEWRISLSRAEVVAAWQLPEVYRCALIAVKTCKGVLGPQAKVLKSYFLKTALFWLCENQPHEDQRSSVTKLALEIMRYLDAAVAKKSLPCFFYADINLLHLSTEEDLRAMRAVIEYLQHHLLQLLTFALAETLEYLAPLIVAHPAEELSERELRVLLCRWRLRCAVVVGCSTHVLGSRINWFEIVPHLLRASAHAELACVVHGGSAGSALQQNLFLALLAAPEDLVGQMRLSLESTGQLVWDVAPLFSLLTPEDVEHLLFDPLDVAAWVSRQRRLPLALQPDGLPSDLTSLRGLTTLLVNAPLLARALGEALPRWQAAMQQAVQKHRHKYPVRTCPTFETARTRALSVSRQKMEDALRGSDTVTPRIRRIAQAWDEERHRLANDPQTRVEHERIRSTVSDPWVLRQFVFRNSTG